MNLNNNFYFMSLKILLRLKEEIAKLFPGNPSPKSQKLVYAGKMLEDGDRLKQFIRQLYMYNIFMYVNFIYYVIYILFLYHVGTNI